MTEQDFKERTKKLALATVRLVDALPRGRAVDGMARQLLKAGTSVGANYRAACRAKSKADMPAKLGIVEEEADETIYWLELLVSAQMASEKDVRQMISEANGILAMTVASIKTLRARNP